MNKRFEPLVWERTEADPIELPGPRLAQSATVRRMSRMNHAISNAQFDEHWDIKKCEREGCGKVFRLKPGHGQWAKRRFCSEACRNAAKQNRSRNRLVTG